MRKTTAMLLKAVGAMTVAVLAVPFPMGAQADTTVQSSNQAVLPIAVSGPAVAVNASSVDGGPNANALFAPAQASQIGDNTTDVTASTEVRSGNAYAGSTVASPIGTASSTADTSVQGQNAALVPLAVTGQAVTASVMTADGGPVANAIISPANAQQSGDNSTSATVDTVARSGDSLSGSQNFSSAAANLPAPPIGRSAQLGWLLFVGLGTYLVLAMGRRPAAGLALVDAPVLSDEGLGVKVRVPDGWEGVRSAHGVLSLFDPHSSTDGSAENAEVAVVCGLRSRSGGDLESYAMAGPPRDPSYQHISSGFVTLGEAEAYRHEFEAEVDGIELHIVEHFLSRPSNPDEIVRLTAYAPTNERRRVFGSLNEILRTVQAA
jgi:hypothetical protein